MSASTASRATNGRSNLPEPSDYPIILGESLKNENPPQSQSQYLRFKYNWEPRQGFSNQKGTLKRSNGSFHLSYKNDKSGSPTYAYSAAKAASASQADDGQAVQLALIFDPEKSAYVLERIAQSLDFNLTSAPGQSTEEVRKHKQINHSRSGDQTAELSGASPLAEQDDEEPDPTNPFDFRHFLSEAKENAEKAAQPTGSRTPVPGSRTPLSGISSPLLAAGRFQPTATSTFRPPPTSAPVLKKPQATKLAGSVTSKRQPVAKRKPAAAATKPSAPQPLSNEVVSDSSDDDTQDTAAVSRPPAAKPQDRGHNRNVSSISASRSPNIVVTSGDLEIDMGSPTHETSRRAVLDLDAFRSQTQTPTLSMRDSRQGRRVPQQDIEMTDRSEDDDHGFNMDKDDSDHHAEADTSVDMDDDVDDLALGSPMPKKADERIHEIQKAPSPPTPMAPPAVDDEEEEEDDFLAAELAKELGQDDEPAAPSNMYDDDESEVSEEE